MNSVMMGRIKKIWVVAVFYLKNGVAAARMQGVTIGNGCRIYIRDFGSEPHLIKIGNCVTIASGVKLLTHDGATCLLTDHLGRRYRFAEIDIGNNVFIGVNSVIMPGVSLGNNVIVAAGSVVTKSIESGKIVGGVPAKIIGDFQSFKEKYMDKLPSDFDRKEFSSKMDFIAYCVGRKK